jgi:hypothetical protein
MLDTRIHAGRGAAGDACELVWKNNNKKIRHPQSLFDPSEASWTFSFFWRSSLCASLAEMQTDAARITGRCGHPGKARKSLLNRVLIEP